MFKSKTAGRTFLVTLVVLLAGCVSEPRPRRDGPPPEGEQKIPEMEGRAAFRQDSLTVDVVLNRAGFAPREERGRPPERGGGGMRGGFPGGGRRGGGRGADDRGRGDNAEGPAMHLTTSNEPPVRLHLRFTNSGDAPLELTIPQFDSALGNFVVQPAKLVVPAHGTAEAVPMTSTLGIPASEIPVSVTLQANGSRESQVIMLRAKVPATPPPSPAP